MRTYWFIPIVLFLLGCRGNQDDWRQTADSLCCQAYRLRYCDADSAARVARRSMALHKNYREGNGRALSVLAFERYQKMDYAQSLLLIDSVARYTDNEVTLLQAEVMRMKVCQRIGDGRGFFQARSKARRHMARIEEEVETLGDIDLCTYQSAWSEYHIIASTYYFYQQQDSLAKAEMHELQPRVEEMSDTVQWLYYSYMMGSGGMIDGTPEEVIRQEFDYLILCFAMARRTNVTYFEANALQALAIRLKTPHDREVVRQAAPDAYGMLYGQHLSWMPSDVEPCDSLLPLALAEHALQEFHSYNDLFQIACVYRTIGELNAYLGDYEAALYAFQCALACVNEHHLTYYPDSRDTLSLHGEEHPAPSCISDVTADGNAMPMSIERKWIESPDIITVPEWMAGIRQQISLLYSAMDMKSASDYNRNIYLDILESTTQNREMENRMAELKEENSVQHGLLLVAACLFAVVVALVTYLFFQMKRHKLGAQLLVHDDTKGTLMLRSDKQRIEALTEQLEEIEEACTTSLRQIGMQKERNAERRAKVSLVQAVIPFLDRIIHEVRRLQASMPQTVLEHPEQRAMRASQFEYVCELCDRIISYNDILTQWIKMEQGSLSLHITTLSLAPLFDLLRMGHFSFDQQGVELCVEPADYKVKADEALTMFMLNTLADNARKFTPQGGRVTISATATDQYVELSVSDTGCGMSQEDIEMILSSKVYDASKIGVAHKEGKGYGFGLMNCKGIIEKYRKTAHLFSVCHFGIESRMGEGSRFFFRLPRVLSLLMTLLFLLFPQHEAKADTPAEQFYEQCFRANVEGRYEEALLYADSALYAISDKLSLMGNDEAPIEAFELWAFKQGLEWDFPLIVNLRNEAAVAALALHDWDTYEYNNRICTTLHKLTHQDRFLPNYCDELERTQNINKQVTVLLVLLSLLAVVLMYTLIRHRRKRADRFAQQLQDKLDSQSDVLSHLKFEENRLYVQNQVLDNCLSTIKHESMYYPARIRQLAERHADADQERLCAEPSRLDDDVQQLAELSDYYRELYSLLCGQAERQVAQSGFRREQISMDALKEMAQTAFLAVKRRVHPSAQLNIHVAQEGNRYVRADGTLVAELFRQLFLYVLTAFPQAESLDLRMQPKEHCLYLTLSHDAIRFSESEAHELFYPDADRIPLLIVKQILRDIDQMNNNPGLHLMADAHSIIFTLTTKSFG